MSLESHRPQPIIIPNRASSRDESISHETCETSKTCTKSASMDMPFDYSSDDENTLEISLLSLTPSSTSSPNSSEKRTDNATTINDDNIDLSSCELEK